MFRQHKPVITTPFKEVPTYTRLVEEYIQNYSFNIFPYLENKPLEIDDKWKMIDRQWIQVLQVSVISWKFGEEESHNFRSRRKLIKLLEIGDARLIQDFGSIYDIYLREAK